MLYEVTITEKCTGTIKVSATDKDEADKLTRDNLADVSWGKIEQEITSIEETDGMVKIGNTE